MTGSLDEPAGGHMDAPQPGPTMASAVADVAVNYPLWLCGKRLAARLPLPRLTELYKGAGTLLLGFGPTVVAEQSTASLLPLEGAAAAGAGGLAAGFVVGAPLENVIMKAHSDNCRVLEALRRIVAEDGVLRTAIAPRGAAMIAAREFVFSICLFHVTDDIARAVSARSPACRGVDGKPSTLGYAVAAPATALICTPFSHVPHVVGSYQQATGMSLGAAVRALVAAGGAGALFGGATARGVSLAGSLFIMPLTLRTAERFGL